MQDINPVTHLFALRPPTAMNTVDTALASYVV